MNRQYGDCHVHARAPRHGASLACEEVRESLRVLVAGCRYFVESGLAVLDGYRGIAVADGLTCGIPPDDLDAHLDEPAADPAWLPAGRLAVADAVVLPPGGRSEEGREGRVLAVDLAPACVAGLIEAELSTARPIVLLVPAEALPRLLVAALAPYVPHVAVLGYVGAGHLRLQLGVAARLRPGRVLAEPAAAALAVRGGLPARSIYAGPGECLLVHAVERALARASLRRLGRVAHHAGSPLLGEAAPRLPEGRPPAAAREVVALRTARRFVLVPAAAITYITSRGGLVTAQTDAGAFWSDRTLGEVASWLDPSRFLRLDASRVVNLCRVRELIPWTRQRYRLRLDDAAKTELVLSRDVGRRLRSVLGW